MTFRRSALAFALMTVSGFAVAAHAAPPEPETAFHPAKGWKVAGNAGGLCSIQSVYNNGFIVGFNGAQEKLRALDINFRQDIFEAQKNYGVTFAIPGQAGEKLSAKAISGSALSIDMKGNNAVIKHLRTASAFDLNVEGNEFRFYLSGFAGAAQPFEQCMGIQTAKTQAPKQEPVPVASEMPKPVTPDTLPVAKTGIAPPPPPVSDDPATINESIALEKAEALKIGITEILPENPPAEIGEEKAPTIAATTEAKPAESAPQAQQLDVSSFSRPRMSERIADKIAENPEIVSIENVPPALREDEKTAAAPIPVPASKPSAPAKKEDIKMEIPAPAPPQNTAPVNAESAPAKNNVKEEIKTATAPGGEKIIFNEPPNAEKKIEIQPPQAAAQERRSPNVVTKSTPPIVVHHDKQEGGTIDLTSYGAVESIEPASNEPFSGPAPERIETSNDARIASAPTPPPAATPETPRRADPEMLRKISELESMVGDLKKENASLNAELKTTLNATKEEQMSISSENWNLERATMRYTEAERELKRLGQQLQQERAQCSVQKQELEAQLFDPQLTSQQQLARLAELEQKLAAAEAQLRALQKTQ